MPDNSLFMHGKTFVLNFLGVVADSLLFLSGLILLFDFAPLSSLEKLHKGPKGNTVPKFI
jgi:hypothetical protein